MTDFPRLFAYDRWANNEVLHTLQALSQPPQRSVKLLAHIVGTQYVWYSRMMPESPTAVWPAWNLQETAAAMDPIAAKWQQLASRGDTFLGSQISYRNSKGEQWTTRNEDVLMHVVMHGAYHRGQIASAIRAAGFEPPYTDYVQAARAGLLP